MLFLIPAFAAAFLLFLKKNRASQRLRALERLLPSALFSAASFPPGTPLERIIDSVEQTTQQPLKEAFAFLKRQVKAGHPVPHALRKLRERYPSALLHRATLLLESSYRTGAPLNEAYRNVAEDAFAFHALEEERKASFAVQKYTIYAGVVLVPAVLGSLFSWVPASPLSNSVWLGLHAYLLLFSVLSALFVTSVERTLPRAWLYALSFAAVCFASFYFAAGRMQLTLP